MRPYTTGSLLFEVEGETSDFLMDRMTPWVHYVPVSSNLGDLRQRFEWARGHDDEARKIAEHGLALVRGLELDGGAVQA